MIIDNKETRVEGAEPPDAPPAYDDLQPPSPGFRRDSKGQNGVPPTSPLAGPSTPRSPGGTTAGRVPSSSNKNWFGLGKWYGEKETRKEVKQTIQSLIRDVVNDPCSPAAVSVMQSCVEACQARGLSFESLVSEKFIEGHCPLYWAIVKRPSASSDPPDDRVQLLDILLSIPLNPTSRSEAYLACLMSSDQILFQRLQRTPGVHTPSVSAADELLLGEVPEDNVSVENREGDHGEFRVSWKIAQFQKRMRAIGGVGTEVVGRGRIWSLAFTVLPRDAASGGSYIKAGTWIASVSLLAPSPPTHLDAQFSIPEPVVSQTIPPVPSPSTSAQPLSAAPDNPTPSQAHRKDFIPRWTSSPKITQKPPITLRVNTDMIRLEPLPLRSTKQDLREHVLTETGYKTLIIPLNKHANGDSLQFDGCSYLNPDGSLNVTFDARLAKPDNSTDCVIC